MEKNDQEQGTFAIETFHIIMGEESWYRGKADLYVRSRVAEAMVSAKWFLGEGVHERG